MNSNQCSSCGGTGPDAEPSLKRSYVGIGTFKSPLTSCYIFSGGVPGTGIEVFEVIENSVLSRAKLEEFVQNASVVLVAGSIDDDCITLCNTGAPCINVVIFKVLDAPDGNADVAADWKQGQEAAALGRGNSLSDENAKQSLEQLKSLAAQAAELLPNGKRTANPYLPARNYCVDAGSVAYNDYTVRQEWARLSQEYRYRNYTCSQLWVHPQWGYNTVVYLNFECAEGRICLTVPRIEIWVSLSYWRVITWRTVWVPA